MNFVADLIVVMLLFLVVYFQMEIIIQSKEKFTEEQLKQRALKYDPYRDLLMDYFETSKAPKTVEMYKGCLLYTSPSPRDISGSRMPSSA